MEYSTHLYSLLLPKLFASRFRILSVGLLFACTQASALLSVTIDQFDETVLEFTLNGTVSRMVGTSSPNGRHQLVLADLGNSAWAQFFQDVTHVSGTSSLTDLSLFEDTDDSYAGDSIRISRVAPNTMNGATFTNYKVRATSFSFAPFNTAALTQLSLRWGNANDSIVQQNAVNVPEPGTYALIAGTFGLGIALLRRSRQRSA